MRRRKGTCCFVVAGLILICLLIISPQAMATTKSHGAGTFTEDANSSEGTSTDLGRALATKTGAIVGKAAQTAVKSVTQPKLGESYASAAPKLKDRSAITLQNDQMNEDSFMIRGLSAGNGTRQNGLWVSGGWVDLDQDQTAIAFDGDSYVVMAGYDHLFLRDRLLAGMALGYEWADLDTTFNQGTLDSDGFTVAPYAAWMFNQAFSFDLVFSYTWLDYDTTRSNGAITGAYDADRWMIAGGLNYNYFKKNWTLGLRIGYLYSSEKTDAFTESNNVFNDERTTNLGQVNMGGQVGYVFGILEPYLGAYYNHDLVREDIIVSNLQEQPSNDPDEVQGVGGINLYPTDTIRANLEVQHVFGRDDFDSTGVSLNLRWEF